MRLGFHVSIADGLDKVTPRAVQLGCETVQVFTRSPRSWRISPISPRTAAAFRAATLAAGIVPVIVHAPYLLNLATDAASLRRRTIAALIAELGRALIIGASLVVVHAGRNNSLDHSRRARQVSRTVDAALRRFDRPGVRLLLENTAGGQGDAGSRFEHLAMIFDGLVKQDQVGVCLDTAHLFAAGYDLRNRLVIDRMLREFDRLVGLRRLWLLHLNDTTAPLGSGIDRHWHVGKGQVGSAGFQALVGHPLLRGLPGIMETPRRTTADDRRNMARMRELMAGQTA